MTRVWCDKYLRCCINLCSPFYLGLIGPLIVCKKGILNASRPWRRKDVQHEFFLRFGLNDESNSWYFNENKNLAGNASTINEGEL